MARDLLQFCQVPTGKRVAIKPDRIEAVMEHENGHTVIITSSDTYQVAEAFEVVLSRLSAVIVGEAG